MDENAVRGFSFYGLIFSPIPHFFGNSGVVAHFIDSRGGRRRNRNTTMRGRLYFAECERREDENCLGIAEVNVKEEDGSGQGNCDYAALPCCRHTDGHTHPNTVRRQILFFPSDPSR